MTTADGSDGSAWYEGLDPESVEAAASAIRSGCSERPRNWPELAIESGFVDNEAEYYDRLHEATVEAAKQAVRERERAADRHLIHAVRAMDDIERVSNELAERLAEWGGAVDDEAETGVEYAESLLARDPGTVNDRLRSLARRIVDLDEEAQALRETIEVSAHDVAPNLSALAGPVLAARLVSLAGGLEDLAKLPSGTVQVLGAEDALFAHLQGHAPSPKHGIIYIHPAVRGTRPSDRGAAARALAGKLTIAARIDHYAGDRRPELDDELAERIETIQARGQR